MAILIALASAAAEAAPHGAAAGGEHASGGLPQLAIETFAGQLFWLAVTFVLLFLILTYVVIPRIGSVLAKRRAQIGGDIAAASAAKSKADEALAAYEDALAKARSNARALADETRNAVRAEADAKRAEAEAKLNADLAAAESRIAATKADALANVRNVAAETAAAIVERLSGEAVNANDAGAAVDAALAR